MRVAFNSFSDSLINQLARLTSEQNQLQNQISSGRRISNLSDDPTAMRQVLDLQAQQSLFSQYRQNIAALQSRATASYNGIHSLQTISQRAGEIATSSDGTASADELHTSATEVTQLIQQAAQLMNSRYQGDYLYGGTVSDQPPFVVTTDATGAVTAVTYQGNTSGAETEIGPGATVSVDVPGANTSGTGPTGLITDSRNGADFFNHLIALQNHLLAGNTAAITASDLPALSHDEDNITSQMAANGLVQSHLDTADSLAATQTAALQQDVSQKSDVDLAQTITRLSATRTAYQAALQSGASLLNQNLSLLDYLH